MINNIRRFALRHLRKMRFLPSNIYAYIHYEHFSGKRLNLKNPKDFNEKIEWYKVYYRPKILNQLVDKYEVRSYVSEKIGDQYLNDLIGAYDHAEEIPFDKLPERFVIKANHTNNCNLLVKDKSTLDKNKAINLCNKWLKKNQYYRKGQEWAYKDVKPKLIVEKFLEEKGRDTLVDYKFYCFNGEPKFIDVHVDREKDHKQGCYDLDFTPLPFAKGKSYNSITTQEIEKPRNLEEMIALSEKLSQSLPFVRVDFYSINGQTIFGELTFYPSDARKEFYPIEYNRTVGDYFELPELEGGNKVITHF